MRRRDSKTGRARWAIGIVLGLVLGAPAAFAEMYSWRTEDGGYAFTDDRDHVPARYAEQVTVLPSRKLADYERFTPQDDAARDEQANRLAERLSYLRSLNAPAPYLAATPATSAATQRTISLSTGNPHAPEIQVPVGQGSGPIVVEPVLAKRSGDVRTRRVTVIQQGGQTIAVIKGAPHQFNPANDIHDEEELEAGALSRY